MVLTPCKNLRKSEVKRGDLVIRTKPSTKTISLTYFGGWRDGYKNQKEGHFLADSETVEIILDKDCPVVNRWDEKVLPWVPYKCSNKYGGVREVYFGTREKVLDSLRYIGIERVRDMGDKVLPIIP